MLAMLPTIAHALKLLSGLDSFQHVFFAHGGSLPEVEKKARNILLTNAFFANISPVENKTVQKVQWNRASNRL